LPGLVAQDDVLGIHPATSWWDSIAEEPDKVALPVTRP
jgi:hypothetical protein